MEKNINGTFIDISQKIQTTLPGKKRSNSSTLQLATTKISFTSNAFKDHIKR
jgi:hypothetical protein